MQGLPYLMSQQVPIISAGTTPVSLPDGLHLAAILHFGDRTAEGRLVHSVGDFWLEIANAYRRDPQSVLSLSAEDFEQFVAGVYRRAGFEVVLTPRSGDHGRDVIAEMKGFGAIRIVEQVKRYRPGHLVTANEVRALYGVLASDPAASKAILTTTSDFAPRVPTEFAHLMPTRLDLRNGARLQAWVEEVRQLPKP